MSAALALLFSLVAMVLIVTARYFAVSGLFAWMTGHRFPGRMAGQRAQIRREIAWSMASAAIYALPAGFVAWGWQRFGWSEIYTDPNAFPLWYMPVSLIVYLLLHDGWFYWTHRAMHRPRLFRLFHAVHHDSRPPTAWAAMSFHWGEAISGAILIPALLFIIPIHVAMLGLVLTIMTVMGVTNHMGWEIFPSALVNGRAGRWLITATHHQRHHDRYRGNYGLYFRHWDRLCGTDLGLGSFVSNDGGGPVVGERAAGEFAVASDQRAAKR